MLGPYSPYKFFLSFLFGLGLGLVSKAGVVVCKIVYVVCRKHLALFPWQAMPDINVALDIRTWKGFKNPTIQSIRFEIL